MKRLKLDLLIIAIMALAAYSCGDDDSPAPAQTIIPEDLSISSENFYPEDIIIIDNTVYASGFGDGTIKSFDLTKTNPPAEDFASAQTGFSQSWGLATDGKVILNNVNNLNFMNFQGEGSKLVEYNIADGSKTGEWAFPMGTTAQSVQIVDGTYYVGDFSNPRVFKIDPGSNTVKTDWFTTDAATWDPTKGGLGGMIYNGKDGFYTSQGGKLWYIPLSNGEAGSLQEVTVSGISNMDIDGISWAGENTIYYATNDAGDGTDDQGVLYKIVLSNNTTAAGSIVQSGFFNSSGVWYLESQGKEYAFVAESQIAVFLGATKESPFKIKVVEL